MRKKKDIVNSLTRAVDAMPQPTFEEIANAKVEKQYQHDFITAQQRPEEKRRRGFTAQKALAVLCACAFVIAGAFGGIWYTENRVTDSVISLDVNPSVEIITNKKDRVIRVVPLNADAEVITEGRDYGDVEVSIAVDALLGSMLKHGYIAAGAENVILLTVGNSDTTKAATLERTLTENIQATLSASAVNPVLIAQTLESKSTADETATASTGKHALVESIIAELGPDFDYDYDDLDDLYELDLAELLTLLRMVESGEHNWRIEESDDLEDLIEGDDDGGDYDDNNRDGVEDDDSDDADSDDDDDDDDSDDSDASLPDAPSPVYIGHQSSDDAGDYSAVSADDDDSDDDDDDDDDSADDDYDDDDDDGGARAPETTRKPTATNAPRHTANPTPAPPSYSDDDGDPTPTPAPPSYSDDDGDPTPTPAPPSYSDDDDPTPTPPSYSDDDDDPPPSPSYSDDDD